MSLYDIRIDIHPAVSIPGDVSAVVYDSLYRDWQVAHSPRERWLESEQGGRFLVARDDDGAALGVLRLLPPERGDVSRIQIRQVAVAQLLRGFGLGRVLMEYAERLASAEGAIELWLNARKQAWNFYTQLAYRFTSDVWLSELTKIPHRTMKKRLGARVGSAGAL